MRGTFVGVLLSLLTTYSAQALEVDAYGMEQPQEVCALCHSLNGISRMDKFPKLAGQSPSYIVKQLRDFKAEARDNDGGQMAAIAEGLTDETRKRVAAYFSSLPPPPPEPLEHVDASISDIIDNGLPSASLPACMSCHAKDRIAGSGAPRIEAQHPGYLAKQLRDFRDGRRHNDPGGVMQDIAAALPDGMIESIAAHLAARER